MDKHVLYVRYHGTCPDVSFPQNLTSLAEITMVSSIGENLHSAVGAWHPLKIGRGYGIPQ